MTIFSVGYGGLVKTDNLRLFLRIRKSRIDALDCLKIFAVWIPYDRARFQKRNSRS